MELLRYWRIIQRRLGLIVVLLAATLLSAIVLRPAPTVSYTASMRFVIGIEPEQGAGNYYTYDRYYAWLTAEYLLDDLSEVVKSRLFAEDVAAVSQVDVPVGAIQAMTSAGKLHRILTVQASWHNERELTAIANAVATVLTDPSSEFFGKLDTPAARAVMIDAPIIAPVGASLRQRLDLSLRLLLALIAGVGLTFLLDYLDQSVRDREEVEALGLPILAEIPRPRRSLWRPGSSKRVA